MLPYLDGMNFHGSILYLLLDMYQRSNFYLAALMIYPSNVTD